MRYCLSNCKMTTYSKNLGGMAPLAPPGYAYGLKPPLENFSTPMEKFVGYSIKLLDVIGSLSENFSSSWYPKLVTGLVVRLQGWGTYLLSCAAWIVHYRLRAAKLINFILNFYLFLTMKKSDFSGLTTYLLIMELRFVAMSYSNSGNENADAGHIKCSRGSQFPHPCSKARAEKANKLKTKWLNQNIATSEYSKIRLSQTIVFTKTEKLSDLNHEQYNHSYGITPRMTEHEAV